MKHHTTILPILLIALVASLLGGCTAVVVGGAATGAAIACSQIDLRWLKENTLEKNMW